MKKKIGLVILSISLIIASVYIYRYITEDPIEAIVETREREHLSFNYEKSSDIEAEIKKYFLDLNEEVLKISLESPNTYTYNNLERQYLVETSSIDKVSRKVEKLANKLYYVTIDMYDDSPPTIHGEDKQLQVGDVFSTDDLHIEATDTVDGKVKFEITSNNVDTSAAGTYTVSVEAKDLNGLKTKRNFTITVSEKEQIPIDNGGSNSSNNGGSNSNNNSGGKKYSPPPVAPSLDRNNLSVRGWKIYANDASVTDSTILGYMGELQNLPYQYTTAYFHTVYIDHQLKYPYLGMAYGDGKMLLNGDRYYATVVLHEATHLYDFVKGFNADPTLVAARNEELYKLPEEFSGNMREDTYEWVANLVVFYYYDQATLRTYAPKSFAYVRDVILK